MKSGWKVLAVAAVCLGELGIIGCGGGGGSQTQIRVLQASPNEGQVDITVDNKTVASDIPYGSANAYVSVNSGSRHVAVVPINTTTPILSQTVTLSSDTASTLILAGLSPNLTSVLLADQNTSATAGTVAVRVVNAAPSMGAADVYVVNSGTSLSGLPPTVPNISFGSASSYTTITLPTSTTATTGNVSVYFTQPGTTLAVLATGPISLTSGQVRTVVALNGQNGGFSFTILSDSN